jgi:cysteine-rich repeat protein
MRCLLRSAITLGLASSVTLACSSPDATDGGFSTFVTTAETGDGDGDGDSSETGDSAETETGGGPTCGDSVVEGDEQCDLGSDNSPAGGCTPDCTLAECGDGYLRADFEECDDGNQDDSDACVDGCKLASCGDGFVELGVEQCDDGNDDDADLCNSMCLPGSCGDGILHDGEQCDDGNRDTTDECPACQLAYCGDGFVEAEIEECDDGNQDPGDECLPTFCVAASCGDGELYVGVEDCDDGNQDDDDDCPTSCVPAACGDGFVQSGVEECDDGNAVDGDGCTAVCVSESKRVFVTSEMFDGNLGGLDGADQKCQMLADAAGLAGTFLAWISTNEGSPSTRFTQSTTPYTLVDGTEIAPNWAGLIDGSLAAAINLTELGQPAPIGNTSCAGGGNPTVWSATTISGGLAGASCSNFTSTAGGGLWGHAGQFSGSWTSWCSGGLCSWTSPIYCFQQ